MSFAGRRFEWDFVLAKVDFAIVDADLLKHNLASGRPVGKAAA
jgi:hypothetical protein